MPISSSHYFFLVTFLFLLTGCQSENASHISNVEDNDPKFADQKNLEMMITKLSNKSPSFFCIEKLSAYLKQGDLQAASRFVNQAIQLNCRIAPLHIVNGLIYEEMAKQGDSQKENLARIAYRSAHSLDPSQWFTLYLMGNADLRSKDYFSAQKHLADALILKPDDKNILYALAYSSYYLYDLMVAISSVSRLLSLYPEDVNAQRAGALIFSAAGQERESEACFQKFKDSVEEDHPEIALVERRIQDWKSHHECAIIKKVAADSTAEGFASRSSSDISDVAQIQKIQQASKPSETAETIVFDCYFLQSRERANATKGNDIMQNLRVSLGAAGGNPLANIFRSLARDTSIAKQFVPIPVVGQITEKFGYEIDAYAVEYSLNIANAVDEEIEVLSRPTISTVLGRPAYFLDGTQYVGAAGGATGASIASVDAGVRLEITPIEITPDGRVALDISLAGSVFTAAPQDKISITNQLVNSTHSKVSATVYAAFGETVVIGGLFQRDTTIQQKGVPLLQDLPFLQYFFSTQKVESKVSSVLYLVTPRRGSSIDQCVKDATKKNKQSASIMRNLQERGFMSLGEYPTLYYIVKNLANSPSFRDFRSGDLPYPIWGAEYSSLSDKINQWVQFIFF